MRNARYRPATEALHAGEDIDPVTGAASAGIVTSVSYKPKEGAKVFSAHDYSPEMGFNYIRWGSPTVRALEERIAALENTEDAVAFASGMAANTAVMLDRLKAGDHAVFGNVCYPGVAEFAHDTLPKFGVKVDFVDPSNLSEVEAAVKKGTKLVFVETPANPILRLCDLAAISKIAHAKGAEVAVDSTFATPVATNPAALGVDFVIHSLTKFLNGHGDVLGGAVAGTKEKLRTLRGETRIHYGQNLGAFEAWLTLRGLQTLFLRMEAHQRNALTLASFLEQHPKVERVLYPGLASHPQHDLAKRQMKNFGGVLSFRLKGGERAAQTALAKTRLIVNAVSLGKSKSLIYFISTTELQKASFRLGPQDLAKYREWAGDGVIRFSVGLEDVEDLQDELNRILG